ncbi:MAG: right-handed parallel beta-helix repeat-containing protein [Dehalococcoidia bacterium]|nr:right-handed parallel beta-helix repeat-containing protein [Dehalococcoidia bacterium]
MRRMILMGVVAVAALQAMAVARAQVATIAVTTLADVVAADGACSLREAASNAADGAATHPDCAAGAAENEILVPAGTIVLDGEELRLGGNVVVRGAGADATVIDANGGSRAFRAVAGGEVTITDLEVRGGVTDSEGGGVYHNGGDLRLKRVRLLDNHAVNMGGAVFSGSDAGALTIVESELAGNSTDGSGGALLFDAEGDPRAAEITGTTFEGNTAAAGGGAVHARLGSMTILDSSFSGNSSGHGGAVSLRRVMFTARDTYFAGNSSTGFGGAVALYDGAEVVLEGVGLEDNTAADGAGVAVLAAPDASRVTITDSTVRRNEATGNGGGVFIEAGELAMERTLVVNNRAELGGGAAWAWVATGEHVEMTFTAVEFGTGSGPTAGAGVGFHAANGTGSLRVDSSTFRGLSSVGYSGLGLFGGVTASIVNSTFMLMPGTAIRVSDPDTELSVVNSTFVGDTAAGVVNAPRLIHAIHDSSVTLTNSVLLLADEAACFEENGGTITGSHNAGDDGTCPGAMAVTSDVVQGHASIGGLTVYRPATGSALVDAADPAQCPATDQLGRPRAGDACDIGSVEHFFEMRVPFVAADGVS